MMNRYCMFVFMLPVVISACASPKIEEHFLKEQELNRIEHDKDTTPICYLPIEKFSEVCFTSETTLGQLPAAVLHKRLRLGIEQLPDTKDSEALGIAICTKGFLLSCELNELISSIGYERDPLVLYQLKEIISGNLTQDMKQLLGIEAPDKELIDMTDEEFKNYLTQVLLRMKKTDQGWRRDWD